MESKTIVIPSNKKSLVSHARGAEISTISTTPIKKIITTKKVWDCISPEDLLEENQKKMAAAGATGAAAAAEDKKIALLHSLVRKKIYSYKSQDLAKDKYCESEFICLKDVFDLFLSADLICHYCQKQVMILYENIREPMQWSLDRIDNSMGHNRGNLYLSCLSCNLRRRCMYPEKYVITKMCAVVKKMPEKNDCF